MSDFTHFDDDGAARMVDVGSKQATHRVAKAAGIVRMKPQTLTKITAGDVRKGNVLEVARLAGIMATKQTGNLIPLCHPLGIDSVSIDFEAIDSEAIEI